MNATAHETTFTVEPARWMVAQSGATSPVVSSLMPFFRTHRMVTGIVAADEQIVSAVKYAGSMFQMTGSGLRRARRQATPYWMRSRRTVRTTLIAMIFSAVTPNAASCPLAVMFAIIAMM